LPASLAPPKAEEEYMMFQTEFSNHLYRELPIPKMKVDDIDFTYEICQSFCYEVTMTNLLGIVSNDSLGVIEVTFSCSKESDTLNTRRIWKSLWSAHGFSAPLLVLVIDESSDEG